MPEKHGLELTTTSTSAKRSKSDLVHVQNNQIYRTLKRTSDLDAPIMHLTGHRGDVLSCRFSNNGNHIASASADKMIFLWKASGDTNNYGLLAGHKSAILQLEWSRDSNRIVSCSTDETVALWDAETGEIIKRCRNHKSIVNSCSISKRGQEMIASCGDDGLIHIWDVRQKNPVKTYQDALPLTAITFSNDGGSVFVGGIDNCIKHWDLRTDAVSYTLTGHEDTVTGLRLSPQGDRLLSNSMDNTVRIWDIKPFFVGNTRLEKIFEGAPHGYEKNLLRPCWSPDSDFIAAGSGDRSVVVWNSRSGKIVYKLPGHKGCVNEVDWSESMIVSCSNDKTLFVGELNPTFISFHYLSF
ncbi:WD40-repeat-containing domain protein [Globomyces pollinis-pini]|nr:WD40-repeat-containing domain protein [Globomyces pollinis-pini]